MHARPATWENSRVSLVQNHAQDVILANTTVVMRQLQWMHALSARQTRFRIHMQARAETIVSATRALRSTIPTIPCALHAFQESIRMLPASRFAVLAQQESTPELSGLMILRSASRAVSMPPRLREALMLRIAPATWVMLVAESHAVFVQWTIGAPVKINKIPVQNSRPRHKAAMK